MFKKVSIDIPESADCTAWELKSNSAVFCFKETNGKWTVVCGQLWTDNFKTLREAKQFALNLFEA